MAMTFYSDFEYLLISAANAFGKDKLLFKDRIEWVKQNGKKLRSLLATADDYNLAYRAVMEIERVIADRNYQSGYRAGLDATASGIQCLSVLAGCIVSASRVGLVDPEKRCDVYTDLMGFMNVYMPEDDQIGVNSVYTRNDHLKPAFMTYWYGSMAKPKEVFGAGSVAYTAFMKAVEDMCPGVSTLFGKLRAVIKDGVIEYSWTLPDGMEIRTPVMIQVDKRVAIDELESSFTHIVNVNAPDEFYCALMANVTHSVDGWLIREVDDRINYKKHKVIKLLNAIENGSRIKRFIREKRKKAIERMVEIAERSNFTSARFLSLVDHTTVHLLPDWLKEKVAVLCKEVLQFEPAPVSSVHDQFDVPLRACNSLRFHYAETLARIAESDTMQFIFQELYGDENMRYEKVTDGTELANYIRNANYQLC